MANEAFALSPMTARAAEPNEQDYDAIREAFMETARGRWFLGEYAKRNRNADTRMVLDAVAKIEETLAAQRQPVVEDRLPEALVEIRSAIREAEAIAIAAFDPAAIEASLAPITRGVRIIKEISWRWREIGADGRICDLIDSQLASIEAACGQTLAIDPRVELAIAFDLLKDRVDQTDGGATAQAPAQDAAAPVADAPAEAAPRAMSADTQVVSTEPAQDGAAAVAASLQASAAPDAVAVEEAGLDQVAPESVAQEMAAFEEPAEALLPEADAAAAFELDAAAQAEDDAVLDAIALEMAAPDPDFDDIIAIAETELTVPEPAEPVVAAEEFATLASEAAPSAAEPAAEAQMAMESLVRLTDAIAEAAAEVLEQPAPAMAASAHFAAPPQATSLPMPSPVMEPSLGATILASGMLQKTPMAANDPLAPIRRMTQAEKIAFFS